MDEPGRDSGRCAASGGARWLAWTWLTVAGAMLVSLMEGALIQRKFGFFTGGFLASHYLRTPAEWLWFAIGSLASDMAIVGVISAIILLLLQFLPLARSAKAFLALVLALAPIVIHNFIAYELLAYLGDAFNFATVMGLAQGKVGDVLAVASSHLVRPAIWILGGGLAVAAVVLLIQRRYPDQVQGAVVARREWGLLARGAAVGLAGLALAAASRTSSPEVDWGFRKKASGWVTGLALQRLLDFDHDGYTSLSRPPDPAPRNPKIHPFAIEVRGNLIDENGVGGDLPVTVPLYVEEARPSPRFTSRPDVLVVLLEGVPASVLEASVEGREVTPVMNGLAREGVSVPRAYAHIASTSPSRQQLMTGSLAGLQVRTSLVDDFKANGYQVAWISGQDESFGLPKLDAGFDRADFKYDARSEPSRRFTTFATAGSLAIPLEVVIEQVRRALAQADPNRPLLLYVNFADTHFPYHHETIRPMLTGVTVPRTDITPARASELRAMFLNTVANVDAALGVVVSAVGGRRGREPAVVVTSDHGESLFDGGILGHGLAIDDSQNRVPFVVRGLPVTLDTTFGLSSARTVIVDALSGDVSAESRPRLRPGGSAFVYLNGPGSPPQIGLADHAGLRICDLRDNRVRIGDRAWTKLDQLTGAERDGTLQLIWTWESIAGALKAPHS